MNILITTGIFPPDSGGPATYGRSMASVLSKGNKVTVLTYSAKRNYKNEEKYLFKILRVWKKIPKPFRHGLFFLKALINVNKSDIVYSLNAVSAGFPALLAARFFKKKFIVKIVGDYSWEIAVNTGKTTLLINDFQGSVKKGRIKTLNKIQTWVCKNSDIVIVPSEYLAKLVKGWGVSEEKIRVIYNGVDFKPANISREEAKKKIGIMGNTLISVGRLVPWKGFKMLIKMMPRILEINQFFCLVIIGDGPDRKNLESMIKNMGLQRKVHLVGRKSAGEIAEYFAASDIYILNSGYEGFSHLILEAMAAGVPLIASGVGGNKEVIRQGENGFLVKYNDEFNILEAIKTLWQMPDLREEFIKEGQKTVEKFSIEKMFRETEELLMSV